MAPLRWISLIALLSAPACGLRDVGGPPGDEQVVVQGVLTAQASEQVLWIERSTAAGEPLGPGLRPLLVPPSRIEVRDTTGAVFSFQPDMANAARFVAAFTPVHGRRYDLLVAAGTRVVRGSAVVPGRLTIVEPAADTVLLTPQDATLQISWAGGSSPWVAIYALPANGPPDPFIVPTLVRRGTSFMMSRYYFYDSTTVVSVLAVDSVTARVIDPSQLGDFTGVLVGNLTGGAGYFGASAGDRFVVRTQ